MKSSMKQRNVNNSERILLVWNITSKVTNNNIEAHVQVPPNEHKNNKARIQENDVLRLLSSKSNKMQVRNAWKP